jgi:hypothetical protein
MDEASRMARAAEQGFTDDVFHSTVRSGATKAKLAQIGEDFEELLPWTHVGTRKAALDRGDYLRRGGRELAPKAEVANIGERTFKLKMRGNYLEVSEGYGWTPADILEQARELGVVTGKESDLALHGKHGPRYLEDQRDNVTALLKKKGYDGVKYTNVVEDPGSMSYMVFNPANLRSATAAKFDPARTGSASLVAGGAGLLGAGLARRQRERE